jgi:membrane protein implicated in regulation of membrane protease activity
MVGEVLPPHIRLGWHCRTHSNHYTIRTDIHIELEFGQMVVVVVALPVFRARRAPFVLDMNFYIQFPLFHSNSLMVYWLARPATMREVRGSIPVQGIVMNC